MLVIAALVFFSVLYYIYRYTFGANPKREFAEDSFPDWAGYEQYAEGFRKRIREVNEMPFQKVSILASDGVPLIGRYYEFKEKAPIVLMFHGYRSAAVRDGIGIIRFCEEEGYNLLLVDQRAHHDSGGKTITFGIKERYDCMDWIRYINRRFGEKTKIVLAGISMGASTVLMAADLGLPANVKGIMADCPFSEPKEILREVMKQMKFPVTVTYTAVKLGAKLFGGFDLEEYSAIEAMKHCSIPVLFIHGEADYFVPCNMSQKCYEACVSMDKKLVLVKDAAHGMSYCVDGELYKKETDEFLQRILK